jgi:acyl-CoA dehydrogenase
MNPAVSAPDPLLLETADRAFAEATRLSATGWSEAAWSRIAEIGLPWLSIPEAAGGTGGSLVDAEAVLALAGRHIVPIPVAETMLVGSWLLAETGHPLPDGPIAVVHDSTGLTLKGSRLSGTASNVAWAGHADLVVSVVNDESGAPTVVVVNAARVDVTLHDDLAGRPRDTVSFADVASWTVLAPASVTAERMGARRQLGAVALIAGAIEQLAALTFTYAGTREQFGKPINRFQSVQQHLVTIEQQSALVAMASRQAAYAAATTDDAALEVGAAAVIAAQAVTIAVRAAHQAHGAIGLTREYALDLLVRNLLAWRAEHLSPREDARRIGRASARGDADRLYPLTPPGALR